MGLIGTDMLCAGDIATAAAKRVNALVAPPLAYAPAEFNMGFAGTMSHYPVICIALFALKYSAPSKDTASNIYMF